MTGALPLCLFGAGVGSFVSGGIRARDFAHRITGLGLMTSALLLAAVPAHADQFRQAADNAEVRCAISSRDLTRISFVGDAFANVSKITTGVPGQDFTVTSEPVRGDIYLSVPDGWNAPSLSFFATSRKGYVYKFVCSVDDVPAEQVFVTNPALAVPSDTPAPAKTRSSAAVDLIAAMAAGGLPAGYKIDQPASVARRVGDLEVRLIAEYRGSDLVGRHFRVDNRGRSVATLDPAKLAPQAALAVSTEDSSLATNRATNLFVVLPSGATQ